MVPLPKQYKPLAPYLALSNEHLERDSCVHFWTLYYFVQRAIEIDKTSPDCTALLADKLKYLEELKTQFKQAAEISDELEAQLHMEQYAEKLFSYADGQDRSKVFNKNVIKAFYTAAHLIDVLTIFGELNEKMTEMRKYARWKSVYLSNCMAKGETPVFGPCDKADGTGGTKESAKNNGGEPKPSVPVDVGSKGRAEEEPKASESAADFEQSMLRSEQLVKAQRLCKYAISALEYEDVKTAVDNLTNALQLLKHCG